MRAVSRRRPLRLIWLPLVLLLVSCDGGGSKESAGTPPPVPTVDTSALRQIVREELEAALAERDAGQPAVCSSALAFTRARPALVRVEARRPGTVVVTSTGTGFVALAGGLVLTASHVVPQGDDIALTLADGRTIPGTLVARNAAADLLLIRASDTRLTPLRWADPTSVAIGEETVIAGFALGRKEPFVTAGVLSGRVPAAQNGGVERLETDANADHGNSGGPVLTLCGEALGVVTAIERGAYTITVATGAATALPFVSTAGSAVTPSPTPTRTP
jgi:S1-C subfamily serine protease